MIDCMHGDEVSYIVVAVVTRDYKINIIHKGVGGSVLGDQ